MERGINKPKHVKKSLTSHIHRFRCINRVISDHDCALHVFPIIILAETEIDGNGKTLTKFERKLSLLIAVKPTYLSFHTTKVQTNKISRSERILHAGLYWSLL